MITINDNEVARLRELLNRAIEICEHRDCTSSVSELRDEIQKLKEATPPANQ
jgi:hypothetical protein